MKDARAWRGLVALITDAVGHGTTAVERIHLQTAQRTFAVLAHVVPGAPLQAVGDAYTVAVAGVYSGVRGVNRAVALTVDGVLRALEPAVSDEGGAADECT